MSKIKELEDLLEEEGVDQLSGGIFKECKSKGKTIYPNTTVEEYCAVKGRQFNITAEEYAEDLLNFMKAPKLEVVGECKRCYNLLIEGDDHVVLGGLLFCSGCV